MTHRNTNLTPIKIKTLIYTKWFCICLSKSIASHLFIDPDNQFLTKEIETLRKGVTFCFLKYTYAFYIDKIINITEISYKLAE